MKRTFRYDEKADMFYEVGAMSNSNEPPPESGPSVISDDLKAGVNGVLHLPSGKPLDSKSAHYRENRARGLEHVGNQTDFAVKRDAPKADTYGREVKAAIEQIAGNYNGTADRLARDREQGGR